MHSPTLISVVLCSRNGAATLEDQLSALANQTYTGSWELISSTTARRTNPLPLRSPGRIASRFASCPRARPASPRGLHAPAMSAPMRHGATCCCSATTTTLRIRAGSPPLRTQRRRRRPWEASTRRNCSTIHACGVGASPGLRTAFRLRSGWFRFRAVATRACGHRPSGRSAASTSTCQYRGGDRLLLAGAAGRLRRAVCPRRDHAHKAPEQPQGTCATVIPLWSRQHRCLSPLPASRHQRHIRLGDHPRSRQTSAASPRRS